MTQINKEEFTTFSHLILDETIQSMQERGYQVLFMPQLVDARIEKKVDWNVWNSTLSIQAVGKTKQGARVVIYAHLPTSLATPESIKASRYQGLIEGYSRFPQDEFQELVDADEKTDAQGNRVIWVVDGQHHKNNSSKHATTEAIDDLKVIAFLGGQERAKLYLQGLQELDEEYDRALKSPKDSLEYILTACSSYTTHINNRSSYRLEYANHLLTTYDFALASFLSLGVRGLRTLYTEGIHVEGVDGFGQTTGRRPNKKIKKI